ncbi:MAG: hypothetical protein ABIV39_06785, partial [Verrucomicrobiota bacterium]
MTLILLGVIAVIYVTTIGLPEFLKGPLLAEVRAAGIQLDFQRIRWLWYRGIVIDRAAFSWLKDPMQPNFSAKEAELDLDLRSLFDSHPRLNSITLKEGSLLWPVAKTNDLSFAFSNITARIQFPNPQTLDLVQLEGDSIGAHIKLEGVITNFTGLRALKFFRPKKDHAGKEDLSQIASTLRQIRLTGDPQLALTFSGDAAEPRSLRGSVKFSTLRAQTPWGNAKNLQLTSELR